MSTQGQPPKSSPDPHPAPPSHSKSSAQEAAASVDDNDRYIAKDDEDLKRRSEERFEASLKQSMPTIADEQRERSDKFKGLAEWDKEHDERSEEEKASTPVQGVVQKQEDPGNPRGDDRARTGRS
jgi:hypothetical protein